ncbi:MAG: holo-ACP synthase [Gemmatimonadota bacterium]
MVVGLGIDIVEVERLEAVFGRHPERAPNRLFTTAELADCDGRSNPSECLAGRFAAKEAFLKALGTGLREGISWTDISLRSGEHGRPELDTTGAAARQLATLGASTVSVSITHDGGMAAAVVLIQTD